MSKEINNLIEDLIEHEAHCPAIYKGGGKGCICVRSKVFYIVSKQRQSIIEVIDDFIKQETMIRTDDTIRLLVDLKKEIKLLK